MSTSGREEWILELKLRSGTKPLSEQWKNRRHYSRLFFFLSQLFLPVVNKMPPTYLSGAYREAQGYKMYKESLLPLPAHYRGTNTGELIPAINPVNLCLLYVSWTTGQECTFLFPFLPIQLWDSDKIQPYVCKYVPRKNSAAELATKYMSFSIPSPMPHSKT